MKCFIAITPSGGTCFVSDLYEGSVDDVKIFAESGILEYINPGSIDLNRSLFELKSI